MEENKKEGKENKEIQSQGVQRDPIRNNAETPKREFKERKPLPKAEKDAQFEKEFMPLIHPLYNFAYRLTLDEDDANDLIQETYMKAYRFFESYEQGTNAKAWLF